MADSEADNNAEYEIIVNPDDSIYQKFSEIYHTMHWGFHTDFYSTSLASYKPNNFRFVTAVTKDKKSPISSVIIARYESVDGSLDLTCLGNYYTIPSRNGQGIGQKVWNTALDPAEWKGKNIGLAAVEDMHEKYASKYGFNKYFKSPYIVCVRQIKDLDLSNLEVDGSVKIVNFEDVDYDKVIAYDTVVSGNQRRDTFLKTWMTSKEMLAAKVALDSSNNVVGYVGMYTKNGHIFVSPLFAVSDTVASTLLKTALQEVVPKIDENEYLIKINFESSTKQEDLFDKLTDKKQYMSKHYGQFTHFVPDVQYDQIYSVTELGINII